MRYEVKLPDLGDEAASEATVSYWLVEEGDEVAESDDLVEMTTDKAAFSIPAPKSGILLEKLVEEGEDIAVGDVLCILEI
ncbi:MAG: biotin/lipoyl-containing protein [FCB group bacterium]|jgi:pyruvate/2-oxoglutarate dehydrogenase complex dihydrolipoamide acyltransferase (E2) component|nr:biotin/lipoyl-containing protein [FCB group bacterium]